MTSTLPTTHTRTAGTALALRKAADLIRRSGWRQDDPASCAPAAELTAEEAITDAAYSTFARPEHGGYLPGTGAPQDAVLATLDAFAGWLIMTGSHDANYVEFRGRRICQEWNDEDGRTMCQVTAALDMAADVLAVHAALTPLAVRPLTMVGS